MLNFENLDKVIFPGVGQYDTPLIEPTYLYPSGEFIPVNYHYTAKDQKSKIIHFFVDDYQFVRYWNTPDKYVPKLAQFKAVCAPDFSTYTDMPLAMQIYNHYRKHWLAAYWQLCGMTVYPTISWSDKKSYDWCFDGEPVGGIVAVSSVGTQNNKEANRTLLKSSNIKFVEKRNRSSETLMETMTAGRIYVTVGGGKDLQQIIYFDRDNKRVKAIDLDHSHKGLREHTQHGYFHSEVDVRNGVKRGATNLTTEERKMVDRVRKLWYSYKRKR